MLHLDERQRRLAGSERGVWVGNRELEAKEEKGGEDIYGDCVGFAGVSWAPRAVPLNAPGRRREDAGGPDERAFL